MTCSKFKLFEKITRCLLAAQLNDAFASSLVLKQYSNIFFLNLNNEQNIIFLALIHFVTEFQCVHISKHVPGRCESGWCWSNLPGYVAVTGWIRS